jgi:tRNA nucleotidyltransferase (CCA-adding enzyme)
MDEAKLREKLAKIEALFAGATTDGERIAAAEARKRIQLRLQSAALNDAPIEYRFTATDSWSQKLLVALLRRYDLKPYRHRGQRRTTVMVKVPKSFVDDTLWPEYQQLASAIRGYIDQITDRIVADVIHRDASDLDERAEPPQLTAGAANSND